MHFGIRAVVAELVRIGGRIGGVCVVSVAAALWFSVAPAAAADGLTVESEVTYIPDPDDGSVRVTENFTLTNITPTDYYASGYTYYYFDEFSYPVPVAARDITVQSGTSDVSFALDPIEQSPFYELLALQLPWRLQYQQTVSFTVEYALQGNAPRSQGFVRINPSYLSFPVQVCCDDGRATVAIDLPEGFELLEVRGPSAETLQFSVGDEGNVELDAENIADVAGFFAQVFARNDEGLVTEVIEYGPGAIVIKSWPDDPIWQSAVRNSIATDLPVLEELIGIEWPIVGDLDIVESAEPRLEGYAGWFSVDTAEIEMSDTLDEEIIVHELSHAWFNPEFGGARWLLEGFAEEFTSQALAETGDPLAHPETPVADHLGAGPLAEWADATGATTPELQLIDDYHYNASWWVIRGLTDEIGLDATASIVQSLWSEQLPGGGARLDPGGRDKLWWGAVLDHAERDHGSTGFQDLLTTWVLTDADKVRLDTRNETHRSFDEFVAASGGLAPPTLVRQEMARWDWGAAEDAMELATEVRIEWFRLLSQATDLNLALDTEIPERWETAAATNVFGSLQSRLAELDDDLGEVKRHRDRVASEADRLDLALPAWQTRPGPADFDAVHVEADARAEELATIDDAHASVRAERDFVTRIGLIGETPEMDVSASRAAFEAGDRDVVFDRATAAEATLARSEEVGERRILWTSVAGGVAVLHALIITGMAVRSFRGWRRRRTRSA